MSDSMVFSSLDTSWQTRAAQIAQLLRAVPAASNAPILIMLGESMAQKAAAVASAACAREVVLLAAHADQDAVAQVIQQSKACVVVCHPAVFGWVSKLAFLNGCVAVYTCGDEQEGTLLNRAAHFDGDVDLLMACGAAQVQFCDAQGCAIK